MAALTSAPFVVLFAFSGIFVLCQDTQEKTAKSGEDVPLDCQGPLHAAIEVLKWRRSDLKSDEYVFFFRGKRALENYQLPSYRGRVELRDPEGRNGNASVILKNVNVNDTGSYECSVPESNGGRRRRHTYIRQTISLKVTDSGNTAGHTEDGGNMDGGNKDGSLHGHVGLISSVFVAVVCCSGLIVFIRQRSLKKKSEPPAADGADEQNSLNA